MKQLTASLAALLVLAVDVISIVVLVTLGHPVPSILETVALVAVGGQAGAALPTLFTTNPAPTLVLTQAAPAAAATPFTVSNVAPVSSVAPVAAPAVPVTVPAPFTVPTFTPPSPVSPVAPVAAPAIAAPTVVTGAGVTSVYPPAGE